MDLFNPKQQVYTENQPGVTPEPILEHSWPSHEKPEPAPDEPQPKEEIRPAPPLSLGDHANLLVSAVREKLSPFIGYSEKELKDTRYQLRIPDTVSDDQFLMEHPHIEKRLNGAARDIWEDFKKWEREGAHPLPYGAAEAIKQSIPEGEGQLPVGTGKVVAGIAEGTDDVAGEILKPSGIALLGLAGAPRAIQKVAAALFAGLMSKAAYGQFKEAHKAIKAGDTEGASRAVTSGILQVGGAFLSAKHAVKGRPVVDGNTEYVGQEPAQPGPQVTTDQPPIDIQATRLDQPQGQLDLPDDKLLTFDPNDPQQQRVILQAALEKALGIPQAPKALPAPQEPPVGSGNPQPVPASPTPISTAKEGIPEGPANPVVQFIEGGQAYPLARQVASSFNVPGKPQTELANDAVTHLWEKADQYQPQTVPLYRGEGQANVALPEWAMANAGEWFTSSKHKAEDFAQARNGQLRMILAPAGVIEKFKAPRGNAPDEYLIPKALQDRWANDTGVAGWASTVMRNYITSQARPTRLARATTSMDEPVGEDTATTTGDLIPAETTGPAESAHLGGVMEVYRQAKAELTPAEQALLDGIERGESQTDTARQLGITQQALSQRLPVIRQKLAARLAQAGIEPQDYLDVANGLDGQEQPSPKGPGIRPKINPRAGESGAANFSFLDPLARILRPYVVKGISLAKAAGQMVNLFGQRIIGFVRRAWASLSSPANTNVSIPIGPRKQSAFQLPAKWGGEEVLKGSGLPDLAGKVRLWEDRRAQVHAKLSNGYSQLQQRYPSSEWTQAKAEAEHFMSLRESGQAGAANGYRMRVSPAGNALIDWMRNTAQQTGAISMHLNLQVQEGNRWRPMVAMGAEHFPRVLTERIQEVLADPEAKANIAEYHQLLQDMVTNGNARSLTEARAMLKRDWSAEATGDYFANAERARGLRLPAKYYATDTDTYLNFLHRFSNRAAQVEAFGQKTTPDTTDAFDDAIARTSDPKLQRYVRQLADGIYGERDTSIAAVPVTTLRKVGSLAYMTGAMTPIRNFYSAMQNSAETFGFTNTARALGRAVKDSAKATVTTLARWAKGNATIAPPEMVSEAQEMGAVQRDLHAAAIMDMADQPTKLDTAVKYSLYVNGVAERLGRSINAAAALTWLRHTQGFAAKNHNSYMARTRLAVLQRLGITGQAQTDLLANLPGAVERFVRLAVREKQFGYTATQSPIAFENAFIKFFAQFQKWGAQRLRDMDRNIIRPALVGDVVNGKRTRNFMPLIRMAILTVLGGEALYQIRHALTGKDRKDATFQEIANSPPDRATALVLERLANDIIMSGSMGLLGDYGANLKEFATRGRFKNPMDPPGFNLLEQIAQVATSTMQRRNTSGLGRDIHTLLKTLPLVNSAEGAAFQLGKAVAPESAFVKDRAKQEDVSWARALASRYVSEKGLDARKAMNAGASVKSPNTEAYQQLSEALLRGDKAEVERIKTEFAGPPGSAGRYQQIRSLASSVDARNPIRVTGLEKEADQRRFMAWVKDRLPAQEVARLNGLYNTYRDTARATGLW